jgi:methylglyoxal synthase
VPDSFIDAQSPSALIVEDEDGEDDEEGELSDVSETEEQASELTSELVIEDEAEVVAPDAVKNENQEDLDKEKNLQFEASSVPTDASMPAIVVGTSSTNNKKIGAELLSQKQIVLIAHDEKVADLTDLVNQHKDFLATCLTISWTPIAASLRQETGMVISKELPSGVAGGFQTIAGLVNSGDVLAVIFLKDFFAQSQAGQANEEALLRLCNINEILLATNIATAESIIHYLQS